MNSFDRQLTDQLHELADVEPGSAPAAQQLMDRGRRARHRRTALMTGTSFAVVALGAVAAVVVAGTPAVSPDGHRGGDSSAVAVADPRVELVAAIANSQNVSFRLKTTTTAQKGDGKTTVPAYTFISETAFDPATASGYIRFDNLEYRLVGGVLYMTNPASVAQWLRQPGTYASLNMEEDGLRGAFVESADSQQLFKALRDGKATVEKTGADTYHFTATSSKDGGTVTFTGELVVGADKRIAKATYDWRLDYKQGGFQNSKVVLEYSGYGEPVTVEAPATFVVID